tara:strand:- start:731 stop:1060 length:330 start_codon:yes stop_codon:yes gene_type:complete
MLERQNALADRDTTRVTTQNAMNGIKGITDDMSSFEKAWSIVKIDDSDCEAVWDLTDSHGLTLGEAVYAYARLNGMSTQERAQLKAACKEYRDAGKYESANLAERMRDD